MYSKGMGAFGFQTPLDLRKTASARWHVLNPLVYVAKAGATHTVPTGFSTDLASIPSFLWNLMPKTGEYDSAAVLHDYLYASLEGLPSGFWKHRFDKSFCDNLFYEAMESLGVGETRRVLMFLAVKYFGFRAWKNHLDK